MSILKLDWHNDTHGSMLIAYRIIADYLDDLEVIIWNDTGIYKEELKWQMS